MSGLIIDTDAGDLESSDALRQQLGDLANRVVTLAAEVDKSTRRRFASYREGIEVADEATAKRIAYGFPLHQRLLALEKLGTVGHVLLARGQPGEKSSIGPYVTEYRGDCRGFTATEEGELPLEFDMLGVIPKKSASQVLLVRYVFKGDQPVGLQQVQGVLDHVPNPSYTVVQTKKTFARNVAATAAILRADDRALAVVYDTTEERLMKLFETP